MRCLPGIPARKKGGIQQKGKTAAQIADELETTEEEIVEIIKKRQ